MAKSKKKIITSAPTKISATSSKSNSNTSVQESTMIFGRENFKWIFIGLALIAVGMLLMVGGSMPSPDVWDESLIYSHRRITLAPIVILTGLAVEIYAIFK
jgi:hypothetical protein